MEGKEFFLSEEPLTEERISAVKNHADYVSALTLSHRVTSCVAVGNFRDCKALLADLFLRELKYSFDFDLVFNVISYFKDYLLIRYTVYELPDLDKILSLCRLDRYETIEDLFQAILSAFERLCRKIEHEKPYTNIVVLGAYYIHVHIAEDIALADMAEYACSTPTHLSKIFHEQMGKTVKQYQAQVRIQRAKTLLETTQLQIGEIARQCGFRDRRYFSDTFKRSTGMAPQQYREEK